MACLGPQAVFAGEFRAIYGASGIWFSKAVWACHLGVRGRVTRKGDVVETVTEIFNTILEWARAGFSEVNAVLGLIIAFVAAFIMPVYGRILVFSLGAVIVHIIAEVMLPVVQGTGSFKLPPLLETYFWQDALVLFIGYLIVISVFFLLKTVFLKK